MKESLKDALSALVDAVRRDGPGVLDAFPGVDEFADLAAAADFLGVSYGSARTLRGRRRRDGSPSWPEPDYRFGPAPVWRYRTLILHRATAPGRGAPGRARVHAERDPGSGRDAIAPCRAEGFPVRAPGADNGQKGQQTAHFHSP